MNFKFIFFFIHSPLLIDTHNFEFLSKDCLTMLKGNFGYANLVSFDTNVGSNESEQQ